MGYFIEIIAELLFGLAKDKPDKMPENISYNPCFTVRHPVKKTIARIIATLIVIGVFSIFWIFVDSDTRILYLIFIVCSSYLFPLVPQIAFLYLFFRNTRNWF